MFEGRELSPRLTLAFLCGLSLIVWFRPLRDLFSLAAGDERYTHIFLIVPVTVTLLVQGWRRHDFTPEWCKPAIWLLTLSLGTLGVSFWGRLDGRPNSSLAGAMLALVVWWIASFTLCFGSRAFREFSFPLLFLFWVVPIPEILVDQVVSVLQRGSALVAHCLFYICGIPVLQEATTLQIPGLELEVAVECSSIRSSMLLLVTTVLLAHQFLRTPWRRWLAILLVVPLAIVKNGLRIATIGMLAIKVNFDFLTGRLHRQGGFVFLSLAIFGILAVIFILRRSEKSYFPLVSSGMHPREQLVDRTAKE